MTENEISREVGRGDTSGLGRAGAGCRTGGLAVLVVAMIFPAAATWVWFVLLAGASGMKPVYAAAKLVQFALPAAWFLGVERRRPAWSAQQPVSARGRGAGVGSGLLFGVAASALIVVVYFGALRGTGLLGPGPAEIRVKVGQLGLATPAGFLALALFYSFAHSALEEYYWRWFVFGRLRRLLPAGAAVPLSSLAFTAHHVIVLAFYFGGTWWMTLVGSAAVFVGGTAWALIYAREGSLIGPWLSHLLVDAALMTVGYDMLWPIS